MILWSTKVKLPADRTTIITFPDPIVHLFTFERVTGDELMTVLTVEVPGVGGGGNL